MLDELFQMPPVGEDYVVGGILTTSKGPYRGAFPKERGPTVGRASIGPNVACPGSVDEFATHFCKNPDGSWTCKSQGTFHGPNGRIQVTAGSKFYPGTRFMGFDLAAWLEEQLRNETQQCGEIERSGADRRHQQERRQHASDPGSE